MTENHNEPVDETIADADLSPEPETFPREYVEKLRAEAAEARVKAKRADSLARELFYSRVQATGLLQDANDLPFEAGLLDDPAKLDTAINELLADHPHYATRIPKGDVGQGPTLEPTNTNLAGILRRNAA